MESTCAYGDDLAILLKSIVDAWLTIVLFAALAHKECDGATVHAFEVDKLVSVNLAEFFTISEVVCSATHAQKVMIV